MTVIHTTYLPFSRDQLREHFTNDADANMDYFEASARRYGEFLAANPVTAGIPLYRSRKARQIEKDERFWTACALKSVFESPNRDEALRTILTLVFGAEPPIAIETWEECLDGDLKLFFEAQLPSPPSYVRERAATSPVSIITEPQEQWTVVMEGDAVGTLLLVRSLTVWEETRY